MISNVNLHTTLSQIGCRITSCPFKHRHLFILNLTRREGLDRVTERIRSPILIKNPYSQCFPQNYTAQKAHIVSLNTGIKLYQWKCFFTIRKHKWYLFHLFGQLGTRHQSVYSFNTGCQLCKPSDCMASHLFLCNIICGKLKIVIYRIKYSNQHLTWLFSEWV